MGNGTVQPKHDNLKVVNKVVINMERGPFPFLDISFKSNEISKRRTGDIGILMRRHS